MHKGNYYLYQVHCVWNKERKRPQKITEAFLGRITETGLVKKDRSAAQAQLPAFYRMTPGNVKEVSAMSLTLQESEVQKAVVSRRIEINDIYCC